MTEPTRGYAQALEIQATPERLFEAFVDPLQLESWYATEASVDRRRGGAFRARVKDGWLRDAAIDVYDPGRRLRLIYMADPTLPPLGSGPLIEDILFDTKPGRTVVRVLGSGVPESREWDAQYLWLRRAWLYWLNCLKKYVETQAPASPKGTTEAPR